MRRLILHVFCALWLGSGALAQSERDPDADPDAVSYESPRAALQRFYEHARRGEYQEAATLLDLPQDRTPHAATLARRLQAVLDRKLWIELDSLSGKAEGDINDRLPPRVEELGRIADPKGVAEPVRLVRTNDAQGQARWRFSRATVSRIDGWYLALPDRWFMERLPPVLLGVGPFGLMWWQWLALPVFALLSALAGRVLGWLSRKVLMRIATHTTAEWDNALVLRSRGPLALMWTIAVAYVALPRLALLPPAQELAHALLKSGVVVALFWSVLRSIDLASDIISTNAAVQSPTARSVLPVAARFAKVAVIAMLVIAVLSNFGLPVASLLAGLGVGGIALALAAQKTVENLFGAVSLGVDRVFRIGDFVKVGDILGNVESIGLRSTRIRTLDRTLITLPNGGLADSKVESMAARDRIRLYAVLSFEYGTTEASMRQVLSEIADHLHKDVRVFPDSVLVKLKELAAYSLNVEVAAALMTQDFAVFQAWRQETLLTIMGIVERAGVRFAFPTQTLQFGPPNAAGSAMSSNDGSADSTRAT